MTQVLPYSASQFGYALIMPNLHPNPVLTGKDAVAYHGRIKNELKRIRKKSKTPVSFEPLMTIQITEQTTPQVVREARALGVVAGKGYPRNMTSNSANGIRDYWKLWPVFEAMQEYGMVLSLHGQSPRARLLEPHREAAFLETLDMIIRAFPELRVVLEHVSTFAAVDYVANYDGGNLAATITLHHLKLNLNDIIGEKLQPDAFCKPAANEYHDQHAVVWAALTSYGNRFFFGSDSAPWTVENKYCKFGCAGIFSEPVALPGLVEFFEQGGSLRSMEAFACDIGRKFYRLPFKPADVVILERKKWTVSKEIGGIIPYLAGQTLDWQVVKD